MWDKFTPSALAIIKSATQEARLSGHPGVDSGHLLFSLARQKGGGMRASQVLREFDLRPEQVYDDLIALKTDHNNAAAQRLPFTPEAEAALRSALEETTRGQFRQIGGDQLLLGLLQTEDSVACQYLLQKGITLEAAQIKLRELSLLEDLDYALERNLETYEPLTNRCSPAMRQTLSLAIRLAYAERAAQLTTAHLLRAALRSENEMSALLTAMVYPIEDLSSYLAQQSRGSAPTVYFNAENPAGLHASAELPVLIQQMDGERERLGDPLLTTLHLLLTILAQTAHPLHDVVQRFGDVNQLNHRRVLERVRSGRSMRAE